MDIPREGICISSKATYLELDFKEKHSSSALAEYADGDHRSHNILCPLALVSFSSCLLVVENHYKISPKRIFCVHCENFYQIQKVVMFYHLVLLAVFHLVLKNWLMNSQVKNKRRFFV